MNKRFSLLFAGVLGICLVLACACTGMAAEAFTKGQKVVVSAADGETPAYASLEDAQKGVDDADMLQAPQELFSRRMYNPVYVVVEQQGEWLCLVEEGMEEEAPVWARVADMTDLAGYLADPANKEVTSCPDE
ncbi:hypothetical protein LJC59_09125, partial [Desulfovibrio sp. OttesenSCG-928-A18]|nr:hypothetical protein [Desulfovibrio sp. OttesenSCG-928-A18]